MARRRYLIAYDISDPKRLRKVIKVMESFGERLQYSVFLCDLSEAERALWETEIRGVIHHIEDSIVWIDLGALAAAPPVNVVGSPRRLPTTGATIV